MTSGLITPSGTPVEQKQTPPQQRMLPRPTELSGKMLQYENKTIDLLHVFSTRVDLQSGLLSFYSPGGEVETIDISCHPRWAKDKFSSEQLRAAYGLVNNIIIRFKLMPGIYWCDLYDDINALVFKSVQAEPVEEAAPTQV